MQRNYATVSGVIERVSGASLIGGASAIQEAALVRHSVQVVRDFFRRAARRSRLAQDPANSREPVEAGAPRGRTERLELLMTRH